MVVPRHTNWQIETEVWNLAGFFTVFRNPQMAGIFLIFSMKILIFFMKISDFRYEKS